MAIPSSRWLRQIAIVIIVVAALAVPVVVLAKMPTVTKALTETVTQAISSLSPPLVIVLGMEAAVLLLAAIWWLWWRLPRRQLHKLDIQIHDPKGRADTEDNFRKTVGQALGGAAVLIGAGVAYLQFIDQQRATRAQLEATYAQVQGSRELLISNQVSKGFEDLGSSGDGKLMVRLGGIYALEGVMNVSPEYYQPVLEALCAFVRARPPSTLVGPTFQIPPADIQAALTVIGRRHMGGEVNLLRANLSNADLYGINLSGAKLSSANLSRTSLEWANLSRALLIGADFTDAFLNQANLSGAELTGVILDKPNGESHILGVNLSGTDLTGTDLSKVDLTAAEGPTQAQLDRACGIPARMPNGFHPPKPCPPR